MLHPVLIVAHGQPSDPAPAEAALSRLAQAVAGQLSGRQVMSATLALSGSLAAAVTALGAGVQVYPLFMAGGWFTRMHLPAKLVEAGASDWHMLEPFGCDPAVQELAVTLAIESGAAEVILAAHGSFKSRVPSDIAHLVAARIAAKGVAVQVGFIDQEPKLSTLTGASDGAVCLPFFAADGGHVAVDIPSALKVSGFKGRILPALGLDARVPGLIAAAISADLPVCAAACRWQERSVGN